MIRYWFEFKESDSIYSLGVQLGCGVTAFNYEDAVKILEETIFIRQKLPAIKNYIENIDIRNLDQGHVIPNMWTPNFRGVWYPIGFHNNNSRH